MKEKPYLNLDSKRPNAGDMARYALRLHRSFGSSTEDPLALSDTDAVEQLHSFCGVCAVSHVVKAKISSPEQK